MAGVAPSRPLTSACGGGRNAGRAGLLDALALDTVALLETRWREVAGVLADRFPESDVGDVAPEELSALPGVQEVLGLHEVAELAASGDWDHVVVDCASTADAMRMLTLPATFGLYLERAWPRHRRLSLTTGDARSAAVVELGDDLVAHGAKVSPEEFGREVRRLGDLLSGDGGLARFEQQRRTTRLRRGVDRVTGMHWLRGEFDPGRARAWFARMRTEDICRRSSR